MSEVSSEFEKNESPQMQWRGKSINNKAVWSAVKWFMYGLQGSGKTDLSCQAPNPFLLSADGNAGHMCGEFLHKERVKTIKDVIGNLEELLMTDHSFKTVILDTIDSILDFCLEDVRKGLSDEDAKRLAKYGSDYRQCVPYMIKIRNLLDELWEKKKTHIIVLGQAKLKVVQNPLVPAYDRWEPLVNEATSRIFMEWVSCVFYAHKDVSFKEDEDAAKGITTKVQKKRLMPFNKEDMDHFLYTSGNAAYCAKNTFNLPSAIRIPEKMGWKTVTELMKNSFNSQNQGL